jgi:hypothetical protein
MSSGVAKFSIWRDAQVAYEVVLPYCLAEELVDNIVLVKNLVGSDFFLGPHLNFCRYLSNHMWDLY